MKISVIIVNYNTANLTSDCLKSIEKYTKEIDYEVIVVDNSSTDGSITMIKDNFPEVKLIELPTNVGFGKANNIGTEIAKGEFVFFLNSDTILIENSIKIMVDFFLKLEKVESVGALGCVLVDENYIPNGSGSKFPNCKSSLRENLSQIPLIKNIVKRIKDEEYPVDKEYFRIDYVIGADLLMRKNIFLQLGGFYKEYFMYFEESDLQYQMLKILSLKSYIYTGTKIVHLAERSGANIKNYSNRKRIISRSSKNIYLRRNDAKNFRFYRWIERCFLFLSNFNHGYTRIENLEFIHEIKKTLKNED